MTKEISKYILILVFFIACIGQLSAIDVPDFPGKEANGVVLRQSQLVEIDVDDNGELSVVASVYEETHHFSENANLYREQSISYSNTFAEITDLEAYSLVPNQRGKFKKIEVSDFTTSDSRSAGVFYDDQKKISYVFPALSAGARTVLSYKKKYREPRLWGYYMFSSFFPVQESEFVVKVGEGITLDFQQFGITDKEVEFTISEKGKYTSYRWFAKELDRIELSRGADGVLHTAPHLIIHVDSYRYNGETHKVLSEVKDLHAWYTNFLEGINDESEDMVMMVNNIVEGKATELEKVEAIYNWVQKNIKYIAIEDGLGGFRPRSSSTVFSRRYGDCKDMSNLLHNMLDLADIPSQLAWIGTTAIPYSHNEVPTPMADNHMICTYINDGRYYFLDATDPYNQLGMPTSHIQGQEALINKGVNDFELVNVPVVPSGDNMVVDSTYLQIEDGVVLGSAKILFSGYNRIPVANNLQNLSEQDKKSFLNMLLKKGNNKFILNSVTTHNVSDKNSDLVIDYEFSLGDYAVNFANEIFINPHLSKELSNELIDSANTPKDIHYNYKRIRSHIYCIRIPEGFSVEYLPENNSFDHGEFSFDLNYKVDDMHITIRQNIDINTLQLKTDEFEFWNQMIKSMLDSYKESIVLVRN